MDNKDKIILDLCGGTGAWSKPYKDNEYNVINITLPKYDVRLFPSLPSENKRLPREFDDINDLRVYGILAAPPCTVFSGSGARWERTDKEMLEGLSIVDACLRIVYATKPIFWALENPIGKLSKWIGKPVIYFHPYEYGNPYTKKTCLWGKFNLPKKNIVEPVEGTKMGKILWNYKDAKERRILRSITPDGFARAFYEANK